MRLTDKQKNIITKSADRIFGETTEVYLFGSRVNDQTRGGDIDLLINAPEANMTSHSKVLFLVDIKQQLGEQKIDVVFNRPNRNDNFISSIKKLAIRL